MSRRGLNCLYLSGTARTLCETVVFAYLPISLYQQTGGEGLVMISLMTAIPAVIRFFAAQAWGSAIDRAGRQKPFLMTGLGAFAVLLALLAANDRPALVVPLIAISATLYSAFSPAARTIATLIDEKAANLPGRSGQTLPTYLKAESVGWLLGGIASGFLLDYFPVTIKHLLIAVSLIASVAVIATGRWLLDVPVGKRSTSPSSDPTSPGPNSKADSEAEGGRRGIGSVWRSLSTLYARPEFAGLLVILFFTFFAREAFFTIYGVYLTQSLQAGTTLYGLSLGIATLLGIFLYDTASKIAKRRGSVRLVRATAVVYVLGYGITVAFPHPWVLAAYFTLPLFPFLTMASAMAVTQMSGAGERGRGLGILEATDLLAIALGSVSAGLIATRWGLEAVPIASFSVGGIGILASYLLRPLWRSGRAEQADRSHSV